MYTGEFLSWFQRWTERRWLIHDCIDDFPSYENSETTYISSASKILEVNDNKYLEKPTIFEFDALDSTPDIALTALASSELGDSTRGIRKKKKKSKRKADEIVIQSNVSKLIRNEFFDQYREIIIEMKNCFHFVNGGNFNQFKTSISRISTEDCIVKAPIGNMTSGSGIDILIYLFKELEIRYPDGTVALVILL